VCHDPPLFQITHGYSKDKRPDLKQLVLAMLCGDANVPILGKLEDGNASDKAINHRLLSNVPGEGEDHYSAEQILRTYKEQNGIEKNFGFLEDDQIVNALFLKRPERIEALGLILLASLLIWRLIELVMRTQLHARQATVPGWDNKPTARPSA